MPKQEEYEIQKAFTKYIQYKYPCLRFCGSSGGMRTTLNQAVKNKLAGYSKGFPDIQIPKPSKGYNGLFIEIKKGKGGVKSPEQKAWIDYLNGQGYKALFAHGLDECIEILEDYLKE